MTTTASTTAQKPARSGAAQAAPPSAERQVRLGEVVSDAMDKTIVVRVRRRVPHPVFKKIVTVSKKFYVHDENNEAKVGDQVTFCPTRPLSRLKRWRLVSVQRKASSQ